MKQGNPEEACNIKWMMKKLDTRFKDEITFTETNGKADVITFSKKEKNIENWICHPMKL